MNSVFNHQALKLSGEKDLIYTAMSKHLFYYRMFISQFVLQQGKVPLNPFMLFDYFLLDVVERDLVRDANNSLIKRADALWVFGPISNGVLAEIQIAQSQKMPICYFRIDQPFKVIEVTAELAEWEEEIKDYQHLLK